MEATRKGETCIVGSLRYRNAWASESAQSVSQRQMTHSWSPAQSGSIRISENDGWCGSVWSLLQVALLSTAACRLTLEDEGPW